MKNIGKKIYFYNSKFPEHHLNEFIVDDAIYEVKESNGEKILSAILTKYSINNYGTTNDSENWHYLYRYDISPYYNSPDCADTGLYKYFDKPNEYILAFEENLNILLKQKENDVKHKRERLNYQIENIDKWMGKE